MMRREVIVTLTRESIECMNDLLWYDLNLFPNEWDQRPDPYRDTITWVIPEQEFLLIVLKHPELLDLEVL